MQKMPFYAIIDQSMYKNSLKNTSTALILRDKHGCKILKSLFLIYLSGSLLGDHSIKVGDNRKRLLGLVS